MTPGRWSHVPAELFHLIPQRFVQTFWSTDSALSFSQGLICSNCKVLMLTADRLKTSSTEQPSQVCVCVCVCLFVLFPFTEQPSHVMSNVDFASPSCLSQRLAAENTNVFVSLTNSFVL